jgi:DNA-directed RNA polymerase subunit E'/Rpb7
MVGSDKLDVQDVVEGDVVRHRRRGIFVHIGDIPGSF